MEFFKILNLGGEASPKSSDRQDLIILIKYEHDKCG